MDISSFRTADRPSSHKNQTGTAILSQEDWVDHGLGTLLKEWASDETRATLIGLFATHMVILPSTPLADRAQAYPSLHPELEKLLRSTILVPVFDSLRLALNSTEPSGTKWRPDIDVRVFALLINYIVENGDSQSSEIFGTHETERLVQFRGRVPQVLDYFDGESRPTRSLKHLQIDSHDAAHAQDPDEYDETLALRPFNHDIVSNYLGGLDIDTVEPTIQPIDEMPEPVDESDDASSNSDDWDSEPSVVPTSLTSQRLALSSADGARLTKDLAVQDPRHSNDRQNFLTPYSEKKLDPFGDSKKDASEKNLTPWQKKRLERRHQKDMAIIHRNAATLTGAKGAQLERIAIPATKVMIKSIIDQEKAEGSRKIEPRPAGSKAKPAAHKPVVTSKGSKAGPGKKKLSTADELRKNIKEEKSAKSGVEGKRWWTDQLRNLSKSSLDAQTRELDLLSSNPRTKDKRIQVEIAMYKIHLMLSSWLANTNRETDAVKTRYGLEIIRNIHELTQVDGLGTSVILLCQGILSTLGFPAMSFRSDVLGGPSMPGEEDLSFQFVRFAHKDPTKPPLYPFLKTTDDHIAFQLEHMGIYMDRSMNGVADPRVNFIPDAWQRGVLDSLDARESVLVVAPTSAGKTFCSYYAMEKVLRESDDGILVYVAPSKALVNQIAAEVSARFSKSSKSGKVSLWPQLHPS